MVSAMIVCLSEAHALGNLLAKAVWNETVSFGENFGYEICAFHGHTFSKFSLKIVSPAPRLWKF